MTYYLNIGTNLGNRQQNLQRAISAIEKALGSTCRVSSVVESEPWGYDSPHKFLNVGVAVDCSLPPEHVLRELQNAEKRLGSASHRTASGNYADRLVDIDIVAIDQMVISQPDLTVPHPRMYQRAFVLQPMAELAPDWVHPVAKLTAAQLLEQLHL